MAAPTSGSNTNNNQIDLNWVAFTSSPNNGGSSITSYVVYWDQGTSTWVELLGETSAYTSSSYTVTTGITSGSTY